LLVTNYSCVVCCFSEDTAKVC